MAEGLTAPLLVAAAVLGVAGVAKLRAPAPAAQALRTLGLPLPGGLLIRMFALVELGLSAWLLAAPTRMAAAALAGLYALFALITAALARQQASCGCFGESGTPASNAQSLISAALAVVALLGAVAGVHGVRWLVEDRSVSTAVVLILGSTGAVYATVVAYSHIPWAWGAWSGR